VIRSIIVGVDDSDTAAQAARVAAELASNIGAMLNVVCAYAAKGWPR
jgi:nucleotide-binding universal stress UspA family protein